MAASVSAIFNLLLTLDETVASELTFVDDQPIRHDFAVLSGLPALQGVIDANSSPAATKGFSGVATILTGSLLNFDLTSLLGPSGTTRDLTGLKPQIVLLAALVGNTDDVVIKLKDTTTGYNLFGPLNTDSDQVTLSPGQVQLHQRNDKGEDVDSTHKDVSFSGGNGNSVAVMMVAG